MSDYGSTPPPPPPPPPPSYGAPGVPGAQGAPPPNHLVWAIVSVFFCWPLAIPSIIFSAQVNNKWALGDVAGAQDASGKAKKFAMWATIIGVTFVVLYVIAIIVGIGTLSFSTGTSSGF